MKTSAVLARPRILCLHAITPRFGTVSRFALITVVLLLAALAGLPGWAAPGRLSLTLSNVPVGVGDIFTVAVNIAGYSDTTELDGYNFRILYDPARFAVVAGSASLRDTAGPAQNWLRFPAQEEVSGPFLLSDVTQFDPGVVHVSVLDLRLPPDPLQPRGTSAAEGFLYELAFTALTSGSGTMALAPAVGDVLLHDAFLIPAGVPDLAGATADFTVTGLRLQIQRTGTNQVTICWPRGVLETTDRLGTSWTPVPASNAFTVPTSNGQRFYRAVLP